MGLADGHQCGRMHGHNYLVEIELSAANVDDTGFVRDFGELRLFKAFIDSEWDHRHLNDVLDFNPTAENMARYIYDRFSQVWPELSAVRVQETETSWAEYRP